MVKKIACILALTTALVACQPAPEEAYFNRGEPESLLDLSTEVVNVRLTSPTSIQEAIDTINKRQPTRAEVKCNDSDSLCKEAMHVMKQFAVPVKYTESNRNNVALIYERVLTRNCQNRFIDITAGPGNLQNIDYPTLGCSVAINMVQMVSDKRQFTNPELMTAPDAGKPEQSITNYNTIYKPDTTFTPMVEAASTGSYSR